MAGEWLTGKFLPAGHLVLAKLGHDAVDRLLALIRRHPRWRATASTLAGGRAGAAFVLNGPNSLALFWR